eukprot:6177630-Pleurochrysis_carterae.AAC.1
MHEEVPLEVATWTTTCSTASYYGAELHINYGLHIRGNRRHLKRSCRSDAPDRVEGGIPHIPPSA